MTSIPGGAFTTTGPLTVASLRQPPQYLVIGPVSISLNDGSIEYGEGYEPDEVARTFWDAMSQPLGTSQAAVERVRTIHHHVECSNVHCKTGGWCIGCDPTGSDDCSEHPWPCPTVLALDPGATLPDQYATWVLKRDHDRQIAEVEAAIGRVRAVHRVSTLHDVVPGRAPYCENCRFAWPCPTVQALEEP